MVNNSTNINKQGLLTSSHWTQKRPRHMAFRNPGPGFGTGSKMWQGLTGSLTSNHWTHTQKNMTYMYDGESGRIKSVYWYPNSSPLNNWNSNGNTDIIYGFRNLLTWSKLLNKYQNISGDIVDQDNNTEKENNIIQLVSCI